MKILVANLGSTSFKYRLFDMNGETLLARGGVDRIGAPQSQCTFESRRPARDQRHGGSRSCGRGALLPGRNSPRKSA